MWPWMCLVWSSIVVIPSGESGTHGLPLLCIGQEVTWQYRGHSGDWNWVVEISEVV